MLAPGIPLAGPWGESFVRGFKPGGKGGLQGSLGGCISFFPIAFVTNYHMLSVLK